MEILIVIRAAIVEAIGSFSSAKLRKTKTIDKSTPVMKAEIEEGSVDEALIESSEKRN